MQSRGSRCKSFRGGRIVTLVQAGGDVYQQANCEHISGGKGGQGQKEHRNVSGRAGRILLERQNREKGREGAGLQMHAGAATKTRHPCVAAQSTFLLWPQRREQARRWPRELLPRPAPPCGQAFVWGSRLQGALATTTPGRVRPAGSQGNEGRQV